MQPPKVALFDEISQKFYYANNNDVVHRPRYDLIDIAEPMKFPWVGRRLASRASQNTRNVRRFTVTVDRKEYNVEEKQYNALSCVENLVENISYQLRTARMRDIRDQYLEK